MKTWLAAFALLTGGWWRTQITTKNSRYRMWCDPESHSLGGRFIALPRSVREHHGRFSALVREYTESSKFQQVLSMVPKIGLVVTEPH